MKRATLLVTLLSSLALPAFSAGAADAAPTPAVPEAPAPACPGDPDPYQTAYDYTVRYFPRWVSWNQFNRSPTNTLVGPIGMGPEFKIIVAANDDTIYAAASVDLSQEPVILTIPAYPNAYSIMQVDVFGNIFGTDLKPTKTGGVYGLVAPGYTGVLPDQVVRVPMPYPYSMVFIRSDKYSSTGADQIAAATAFRASLRMQPLSKYQTDPQAGATLEEPLSKYDVPMKRLADQAIESATVGFFETLQEALAAPTTVPLADSDRALIAQFDCVFKAAQQQGDRALEVLTTAARAAHTDFVTRWKWHTGSTYWSHFGNIGHWGTAYLDRAALTEFMQFDNDRETAYYAHAFMDSEQRPLDGRSAYKITFKADRLPKYDRFWSLTAYTPEDVELVPNPAHKYVVASYTPGLVTAGDGSITLYVQPDQPKTAPVPNWLPVPKGPFSMVLRVYGPQGTARSGTYEPPVVERIKPIALPAFQTAT